MVDDPAYFLHLVDPPAGAWMFPELTGSSLVLQWVVYKDRAIELNNHDITDDYSGLLVKFSSYEEFNDHARQALALSQDQLLRKQNSVRLQLGMPCLKEPVLPQLMTILPKHELHMSWLRRMQQLHAERRANRTTTKPTRRVIILELAVNNRSKVTVQIKPVLTPPTPLHGTRPPTTGLRRFTRCVPAAPTLDAPTIENPLSPVPAPTTVPTHDAPSTTPSPIPETSPPLLSSPSPVLTTQSYNTSVILVSSGSDDVHQIELTPGSVDNVYFNEYTPGSLDDVYQNEFTPGSPDQLSCTPVTTPSVSATPDSDPEWRPTQETSPLLDYVPETDDEDEGL